MKPLLVQLMNLVLPFYIEGLLSASCQTRYIEAGYLDGANPVNRLESFLRSATLVSVANLITDSITKVECYTGLRGSLTKLVIQ